MEYFETIRNVKKSIALITTEKGAGSGFVFHENSLLVTCNHIINGCKKIFIKFLDSEFMNAEIIIRDEEHDLALLKFNDTKVRIPLTLANHGNVREGMSVIFSGYPLGLKELTTHHGIISAITKDPVGIVTYLIDGTVNRGNSGCPLMNINGEVIGIVNAMRVERGDVLDKIRSMEIGAISLYKTDLVDILQSIIKNFQLGIGYAVPASYIPGHKIIKSNNKNGGEK